MKILHNNGKISQSIYDDDLFKSVYNDGLEVFEIDEVDPANKEICKELQRFGNNRRLNSNGESKYYISNGELFPRENWEEELEINS